MNKRPMLETVVLSVALILIPLVTRAALYGDLKSIEGIVKAVADDTVTVTAQSPDGKQTGEIDFHAKPETQYQDIKLTDLKEGDRIKVKYHEDQDMKTADSIAKIQP